jgi:hypothetical protein
MVPTQMCDTMLPDAPLSPPAAELIAQLRPRIRQHLSEINKIPVAVLLWGPGIDSNSPLGPVRADLRTKLRNLGHAAFYSEELCDVELPLSTRLQELAQAQEFELVVSIPCTPGSIAEIHDFAADRRIHAKILAFLNERHLSGYGAQSLAVLQTVISCRIEYYPNENQTGVIADLTLIEVQRIRELKYLLAGRYV